MKCIIIEDAKGAREHLERQLDLSGFDIEITDRLDSIKSSIAWLKENTTDLIFLDIELADGISFEIFDNVQVQVPIIFTTSYNQYAIKAFEVNAIAYLLKPVKLRDLVQALEKSQKLFGQTTNINEKIVTIHQQYQERFLVQKGTRMLPLRVEDIAYFRIHTGRYVLITTIDKQQFLIDNKLEILEVRLDPSMFLRINRQYIININSIKEITAEENGKLKLTVIPPANEDIIIGRERASAFRTWLTK